MARRVAVAAGLLLVTAIPPVAWWWEASLVRHMLMQIPMLILAGIMLGSLRRPDPARDAAATARGRQADGIAAVLLGAFTVAFWMLPRWLDAAAGDARVDAVKIVTLVLLAGLPLGWGWPRLGGIARAFFWAQAISMAAVLGVLYLTFPERLCNSYLVSEQPVLGAVMLAVAGILALCGAARALFGLGKRDRPGGPPIGQERGRRHIAGGPPAATPGVGTD